MITLLEKIDILNSVYVSKEKLNNLLDIMQKNIAYSIGQEKKPIPPLKRVVEMTKTQLLLDKKDPNYLLADSKYQKRNVFAQRTLNNDAEIREVTYSLLISTKDVHLKNSEEDLKGFLEELVDEIARVTEEERNAIIPEDEEL